MTNVFHCGILFELSRDSRGLVAQLDRVFDYESKGRGFESRRAHFPGSVDKQGFRGFFFPPEKVSEMVKSVHKCAFSWSKWWSKRGSDLWGQAHRLFREKPPFPYFQGFQRFSERNSGDDRLTGSDCENAFLSIIMHILHAQGLKRGSKSGPCRAEI